MLCFFNRKPLVIQTKLKYMPKKSETLYLIKTNAGYLKGSKDIMAGSEPAFTHTWENARLYEKHKISNVTDYHCIRNYTTEIVKVNYTKQ